MRGRALDDAGDEGPPLIVRLAEDPDSGIADLAVRKHIAEPPMTQGAQEDVGELVIGRLVGRVIVRVGGAELGQHGVDDRGAPLPRARRLGLRSVARPHRPPVHPVEARIVEPVAHQFPHPVKGRVFGFGRHLDARRRLRLRAGRLRPEGEQGRNPKKLPARSRHLKFCFRLSEEWRRPR